MTAPHPIAVAALSVLAVLALSACSGSPDPDPTSTPTASSEEAGLTGTLEYETGSVPPPYHYSLTLEVTEEQFTLVWSGYDEEVGRTTGTPLDLEAARDLLAGSGLLEGDDDTDGCVGGAQARLDLVVDGDEVQTRGGSCGGQGGAGEVADAIRAIAGDAVVDDAIAEVEDAG